MASRRHLLVMTISWCRLSYDSRQVLRCGNVFLVGKALWKCFPSKIRNILECFPSGEGILEVFPGWGRHCEVLPEWGRHC